MCKFFVDIKKLVNLIFCHFRTSIIGQIKKKSVMYTLNGKVTLNWAGHCNY